MALTLDVPEVQVLVHYPHDPSGLTWHHRVLLHKVDAGDWITLTPDHEFQRHNLATHNHRILDRNSPFPLDILAEVYAHDPVSRSQMQMFKRQSQVMAAILGEGAVDELDTIGWVIADPSHMRFGEVVDSQLLSSEATGIAFTTRGVVLVEGEEIFVERIDLKELEEWKAKKGKELGDVRLLGDHRDNAGKRNLDLGAATALMHAAEDKEFPVAGTRSAKQLHEAVAAGPGNFLSYHAAQWGEWPFFFWTVHRWQVVRHFVGGSSRLSWRWKGAHRCRTTAALTLWPARPPFLMVGHPPTNSMSGFHLDFANEHRFGSRRSTSRRRADLVEVGVDLAWEQMMIQMKKMRVVAGRSRRRRRNKVEKEERERIQPAARPAPSSDFGQPLGG